MGNHVLEYVIKLTDKVSAVAEKVADGVKRMASRVSGSMNDTAKAVEGGNRRIEEKFVHTEQVLDKMGLAYERLGVKGRDFTDAMDVLERRLDNFNRTGQGQEELFNHLKLSLEDFGASEKQVAAGLEMLKANLIDTGNAAKESAVAGANVGVAMGKGFREAHLAAGVLNGNVYSLSRALSLVARDFKALNISAGCLTAISAAVMACVIVGQKLYAAFKSHREELERIRQLRFEETLKNIADVQAEVTREITGTNSKLQEEQRHNEEIINQKREQLRIENELARAQELRTAKTDEERKAINAMHDDYNRQLEREAEIARLELTKGTNEARIAKYGAAIAKLQKADSGMEGGQGDANRRMRSLIDKRRRELEDYYAFDTPFDLTEADAQNRNIRPIQNTGARRRQLIRRHQADIDRELEKFALTDEDYNKAKADAEKWEERRKSIKEQIEKLKEDRRQLENRNGEIAGNEDNEYGRSLLEYEQMITDLEKVDEEYLDRRRKERQKELEQERRDEIRAANEIVAERLAIEQDANARLAAAQQKVSEAWGFYKDRDSLAAHDAGVDADVSAGDRYAKDYHTLTHGRDSGKYAHLKYLADHKGDQAVEEQLSEWRRKKSISVDSEATMRVALANREQVAAQDYAKQTAEATEAARDYLESINDALTSGGEE